MSNQRKRPGGLLAICVIGILLGALGLCMSGFAAFGLVISPQVFEMQERMLQQPGMPRDPATDRMLQSQRRIQEVTERWYPVQGAIILFDIVLSIALLGGSVVALSWSAFAPSALVGIFGAGTLYEVAKTGVSIWIQIANTEALQAAFQSDPAMGGMQGSVAAGMTIGICFAVGWAVLKIAYFASGLVYMRKRDTRDLFA